MAKKEVLLSLKNIKNYFPVKKGVFKKVVGYVKATDDVTINIYKGETIGLVGESGCGKTTLGKSILRLIPNTTGEMLYKIDGKFEDLNKLSKAKNFEARKKIQIVFQDPHSSLNPAFTIYSSLSDPLKLHGYKTKEERKKVIGDLLEKVNLRREHMERYPHEFSGGQRQRIGIARALSVNPELIICDEAVSALDVSIQAQVLNLLMDLKEEKNLTYIFITHDLSVVEYISDRIAVMYLGKIVELGETEDILTKTMHPYTKALLSAVPTTDKDKKNKRIILKGDVPSPVNPPSGCSFHPRCISALDICKTTVPTLKNYSKNDVEHFTSCHLY